MFSNAGSGVKNETNDHLSDKDSIMNEDPQLTNQKTSAVPDKKVISELERLIINLNHTAM